MNLPDFEYLGPYRVERTLGRGGMGTVYKGVHAKSGEAVAIKVIATGVANQSRFRRRFAAEVETLKRLKHPNIVSLVGYGEEHGLLFYSMEYVDGHSLHQYLRQHSRLPWEDVVEVGIQTTAALKHAHDLGIIHRDLKPANLMLNKDEQLKLTDFGIAKLFGSSDMTAAGSVIGTADYMPPEQAEGKGVTARSDLYSLGGVMYTLLAGRAPFGGKSIPEVLYAVRYNPVPNLAQLAPDAPEELCQLVTQLLHKNPEKRPPTALVVGNRLKALQQGMKKRGVNRDGPTSSPLLAATDPISSELTSLDLSDVDDAELKLTDAEQELAEPLSSHLSSQTLPTHEQQTILAPRKPDKEASQDAEPTPSKHDSVNNSCHVNGATSVADANEEIASEFSQFGSSDEFPRLSRDGPLSSGGPSHFTPVSEDDVPPFSLAPSRESASNATDWVHYGSIAGIIGSLLICLGFAWWMLQPRSADEVFERIMAAVETGDDSQLLTVQGDIDEFLSRFSDDDRRADVESIADEIELARWTKVLQRRASREGGRNELSAIEQGFLDGMLARSENADVATAKLAAFINVFGSIENLTRNEQRLVELAKYALATGAEPERSTPAALLQLEDLIRSAEQALSGAELTDFYQSLVLLYGDKPWAEAQIKRIRAKLETES